MRVGDVGPPTPALHTQAGGEDAPPESNGQKIFKHLAATLMQQARARAPGRALLRSLSPDARLLRPPLTPPRAARSPPHPAFLRRRRTWPRCRCSTRASTGSGTTPCTCIRRLTRCSWQTGRSRRRPPCSARRTRASPTWCGGGAPRSPGGCVRVCVACQRVRRCSPCRSVRQLTWCVWRRSPQGSFGTDGSFAVYRAGSREAEMSGIDLKEMLRA